MFTWWHVKQKFRVPIAVRPHWDDMFIDQISKYVAQLSDSLFRARIPIWGTTSRCWNKHFCHKGDIRCWMHMSFNILSKVNTLTHFVGTSQLSGPRTHRPVMHSPFRLGIWNFWDSLAGWSSRSQKRLVIFNIFHWLCSIQNRTLSPCLRHILFSSSSQFIDTTASLSGHFCDTSALHFTMMRSTPFV